MKMYQLIDPQHHHLRHLPPQNDVAVKTATLAEDAAAGGLASLPGEPDAAVDFTVTVE